MSIYYKDHVQILSDLLPPDIAGILNITSSHLNIGGLNSLEDICINKAKIFRYAQKSFINEKDEILQNLNIKDDYLYYLDKKLFPVKSKNLDRIYPNLIKIYNEQFLIKNSILVKPFLFSKLSLVQYAMACEIAEFIGLSKSQINDYIQNYIPVENRLQKVNAFGKELIFDGDITTYERIGELSQHLYAKSYLILRKVGSAENIDRIEKISEHFPKFDKVYLFSDIDYLEDLQYSRDNVIIVNNHDFITTLDAPIFYHYSGYYRSFEKFTENNLRIYDRDKYVIKKRGG